MSPELVADRYLTLALRTGLRAFVAHRSAPVARQPFTRPENRRPRTRAAAPASSIRRLPTRHERAAIVQGIPPFIPLP